MMTAVTKLHTL